MAGRQPQDCLSGVFAINQAWLQLALTGVDLIAWTRHPLLEGELATAEPKKPRYRLLHVATRITRTARHTRPRIAEGRRWVGGPRLPRRAIGVPVNSGGPPQDQLPGSRP